MKASLLRQGWGSSTIALSLAQIILTEAPWICIKMSKTI